MDEDVGYLLEVDVDYPDELHDAHQDLPFFPESKLPPDHSPYSKASFKKAGVLTAFKTKKLICDLTNKRNYIVHYPCWH